MSEIKILNLVNHTKLEYDKMLFIDSLKKNNA